jgi:hypothetical protein
MEHSVPEGQGQDHGCLDMRRHPTFGFPSCSRCNCPTQLRLLRIPGRIGAVAPFAGGLKGSEVHNRVRNPVYIVT